MPRYDRRLMIIWMESILSPSPRVVVDVAANGLPFTFCASDTIIESGLPGNGVRSSPSDAFGAARLELTHDGTQRMGTQCC